MNANIAWGNVEHTIAVNVGAPPTKYIYVYTWYTRYSFQCRTSNDNRSLSIAKTKRRNAFDIRYCEDLHNFYRLLWQEKRHTVHRTYLKA